jgi:hypothetical protein
MKDVKKWKTEWDLSIYYKSPSDPQIEKGFTRNRRSCG